MHFLVAIWVHGVFEFQLKKSRCCGQKRPVRDIRQLPGISMPGKVKDISPDEGTAGPSCCHAGYPSIQPSLRDLAKSGRDPALKRRAISTHPFGIKQWGPLGWRLDLTLAVNRFRSLSGHFQQFIGRGPIPRRRSAGQFLFDGRIGQFGIAITVWARQIDRAAGDTH